MLQDLRIDVPELEPDPVLLAQLSQLSAAAVARPKDGPARALVAGVTVLILACFAWLTGAVPGVASPFDGVRDPRPAPHAPRTTPTPEQVAEAGASATGEALAAPGGVGTLHDQGNHTGLAKPNHHDNGNHTGLYGAQHDNGNHTGQTKPHTNQGNHHGQTRPHTDQGNHHGQTKPHQHGHPDQPPTGPGNGNGNGQRE
ncbi:MAG TPA: hypothetical protein VFV89_22340 [Nocardioides sp.]|uniref:hypothetical protein n=1 Tax=Nocardioides sp. TaxID=35761 RepID=UPI002E33D1A3|nr:hypothetical protein [Nocardioides sp.]HEX5090565.1 hypothetical protein [Nocardioides sp.]